MAGESREWLARACYAEDGGESVASGLPSGSPLAYRKDERGVI